MGYEDLRMMIAETPLERTSSAMLATLKAMGQGWYSRAQIATQAGKARLNPSEIAALDLLVSTGTIESQLAIGKRINANQYQYRVK
jgi:hypothetical protein